MGVGVNILRPFGAIVHLTLSLLLLARQAEASSTSVVEVVPSDAGSEHGWCSVAVDRETDELVITSSARTWDRMAAVFEDGLAAGDVLRIVVPGRGAAARVAPLLREANPTLMIVDDPATNTILVTGDREEG